MLDGRVKTLHPKIYAGILNIRKNKKHKKDLKIKKIPNIDLVIVDLYPFENMLNKNVKNNELIEYIDVGGPTLIRAAAKNFNDVTVISDVDDYKLLTKELLVNKGSTSIQFRQKMSAKAFGLTARYDSIIADWMNNILNIKFPKNISIHGKLVEKLRYGENPHQEGSFYKIENNLDIKQLHGKSLSYNNYNDIYSALTILKSPSKKSRHSNH